MREDHAMPEPAARRCQATRPSNRQARRRRDGGSAPSPGAGPAAAGETGTLVLVIGPSGAGKDTLISAARAKLAANARLVFPQRILTRAPVGSEGHCSVARRTFAALESAGALLLSWQAQGVCYGLPASIRDDLAAGRTVVANVWRDAVPLALAIWPRVHVIEVAVGPECVRAQLRDQMLGHRRSQPATGAARPWRSDRITAGPRLEQAVDAFVRLLAQHAGARPDDGRAAATAPPPRSGRRARASDAV